MKLKIIKGILVWVNMIIKIVLGIVYESMDSCKIIARFGVNNWRSSILHNLKILSTFDSIYENALSLIHVRKSYYVLFHSSSLDMRMDIKHVHAWDDVSF